MFTSVSRSSRERTRFTEPCSMRLSLPLVLAKSCLRRNRRSANAGAVCQAENRTDAAMTSSHDWIVVALFKPTANGWIFRAPNPWLFGRGPHYVVNDEQRAQIAELLRPTRPVRTILALFIVLLAWVPLVCAAMWA